jgi:hypothetical protein
MLLRSSNVRGPRLLAALFVVATAAGACEARDEGSSPAGRSSDAIEVQTPRWPGADSLDRAALARLPNEAREAVRRSPVPVLVPATGELLAAAKVMPETHFYAFWSRAGGVTVSMQATRVLHRHGGIAAPPTPHRVRGQPAIVTENTGIRTATWIEDGVSYSIDVECAAAGDTRCADTGFVIGLASGLAYVGGSGQEVAR